jgi:hypothetical protein
MSDIKMGVYKIIFLNWRYSLLALISFFCFFVLVIIISSYKLIIFFLLSRGLELFFSGEIFILVWDFFKLNSTNFSRSMAIINSFLSGINLAMFVYYMSRRIKLYKSAGLGFMGMLVSFLGIGCASCGSVIITSIFGFGATAFLGALPLHGLEISIFGSIFLLVSIHLLANKIANPLFCKSSKLKPI